MSRSSALPMASFWFDIVRDPGTRYTVVVLDEGGRGTPRQYEIYPRAFRRDLLIGGGGLVALVVALLVWTPLRGLVLGYSTEELRLKAEENAIRVRQLGDSLAIQQQYATQLRRLITGEEEAPTVEEAEAAPEPDDPASGQTEVAIASASEHWSDHQQPALPVDQMPSRAGVPIRPAVLMQEYLSGLRFPMEAPLDGFISQPFDARSGHFGVDFAVDEGTLVRAVGDGYVIFADWTNAFGYMVMVQHSGGFVSVYKHNRRISKQVGDRVRRQEVIAESGNTGTYTTAPHLHFELWYGGLAQDPAHYLLLP